MHVASQASTARIPDRDIRRRGGRWGESEHVRSRAA